MDKKDFFKIGYIAKTHGLKGEVTTQFDSSFLGLDSGDYCLIELDGNLVPFQIEAISINGSKAFLKFDKVDNIDQATKLKGCSLFQARSDRPKLKRGEFYSDELVGFSVFEKSVGTLGKVVGIENQGPNELLAIENNILIPLNSPFIISILKTKKRIEVELPEGFLEI